MISQPSLLKDGLRVAGDICEGELRAHALYWIHNEIYKNTVVWLAFADGKPVGFAGGHLANLRNKDAVKFFILDIICTKKIKGCTNVGTHLIHQVEKAARRMGAKYMKLESVVPAIRFYTRQGYVRSANPCASRVDRALADAQARSQYEEIVQKYRRVGREPPDFWYLLDGRIYPGNSLDSWDTVILTKCLKK
jgi:GNAT superfamily N-acetyltransferase